MLPAAANCRGCRLRDRELRILKDCLRQRDADSARVQRRCARLKKDNDRLRAALDEAHRQSHRQANPFRRHTHKKRKKKPGRRRGHKPTCGPRPRLSKSIASSTSPAHAAPIVTSNWSTRKPSSSIRPICRPSCPSSCKAPPNPFKGLPSFHGFPRFCENLALTANAHTIHT